MADRFPLAVNYTSRKIEEFVSGDNLDLTGNGIVINGSVGISGQYLKSTGAGLVWDNPGNVYLTDVQTITNKTIESSFLSGTTNTFVNIANTSLVNDFITINGVDIDLGSTVTTPNDNTTYAISAQDGAAGKKIIRLTSGGNFGSGVNDDITLVAGTNVTLARSGDEITINSSYVDTNTVTRLAGTGGTFQSGDVTIAASGSVSVAQVGNTITLTGVDTNTVTRLRGTGAGTFVSGDVSILASGATTVTQSSNDITISSQDTITRVRATGGSYQSGDITIAVATGTTTTGANGLSTTTGAASISQVGNTITIDSTYTDTITKIRGTTSGTYESGDVTLVASGATTISQNGKTITISSVNTDTGAALTASKGIVLNLENFEFKNADNLTGSRVTKWDSANSQLVSSIMEDDGSLITINGDLKVTGSTTTVESQTLVIADAQIELRRGLNLTGTDGGVQVNRTTNGLGLVTTYSALQWYESGQYWRTYDGSVANRLVTEGETQTLTNKTLTSPTLTNPSLGLATATSINGLAISQTVSGTLTIASNKTLTASNTLTFTGTDGSSVAFGGGGTVAYTANNLSVFANTTSSQLRGILTDETGTGVAVFGTSPRFTTSVTTQSASFDVFNTGATTVNAFGASTILTIAATTGTTTIRNSLAVDGNTTLGNATGDTITINGTLDSVNNDIIIRGSSLAPIAIGRGGNSIASNTRVGYNALNSNTSGTQNTAFGYDSAFTLNSGARNTALGYQALRSGSTADDNVAIGSGSAFNNLDGDKNVAVGSSSLSENQFGNSNVCIGYFSGYNCLGSGNVLIGPADNGNSGDATYQPPSVSGDRQLVIGSGTGTWLRGDNAFNLTVPNSLNIGGTLTISGNIVVNGTTTTINSNTLTVDDKTIEMGSVIVTNFVATTTNNNSTITGISPTAGLIPGVVLSSLTAGITVPVGTYIVSITGTTAVLSQNVSGSGTATFTTEGASDISANNGGIVLKGTTDKTILWSDTTDAWTSSEHFDLATGKAYRIGNVQIANGLTTTLGPTTGSWFLGAGVTGSSLTSVGTLSTLTVSGATNFNQTTKFGTNTFATTYSTQAGELVLQNGTTDTPGIHFYYANNKNFGIDAGVLSAGEEGMRFVYNLGETGGTVYGSFSDQTSNFKIHAGNLVFGTSGKGIDFSADANAAGMTSELLDDYEEGTWTPVLTGFTNEGTTTGRVRDYIKIGNQVTVWFDIFQNSNNMSFSNGATITGLPFITSTISGGDSFHTQVNVQYFRGGGEIVLMTAYIETTDTIVIRGASANSDIRHIWGHVTYTTS